MSSNFSAAKLRMTVAALYWGEGAKTRTSFKISNTDPSMIRFLLKFLREETDFPEDRFRFRVQLHPSLSERGAKTYWARVADTRPVNIKVTKNMSKTNKGKQKGCPHGCLEVAIHDTLFRAEVEGWMDQLKSYTGLTQR